VEELELVWVCCGWRTPPTTDSQTFRFRRCQLAYATWQLSTTARPTTFHVCQTKGCLCTFRILMKGGVWPETCWALFKIRNNKIVYSVAFCWIFYYKNCTMMHGSTNIRF
jgi:hypothetical protein